MHCKTRDIKIEKYEIIQQPQSSYRYYPSDRDFSIMGENHIMKASYQGGRIKPLKYSVEHPILVNVGLRHPIIPKSLS